MKIWVNFEFLHSLVQEPVYSNALKGLRKAIPVMLNLSGKVALKCVSTTVPAIGFISKT